MNNDVLKKIKEEVLQNDKVKSFCDANKLSDSSIESNLLVFSQFSEADDICKACKGEKECMLEPKNCQLELKYDGMVSLKYVSCQFKEEDLSKYLELVCFPDDYALNDLYASHARTGLYKAIKEYQTRPLKGKGIYLWGKFGVGKTFVFYTMATELAKKKIHVMFVNYPDFCRHLKLSITNDGEVETLIDKCKKVDCLILDDIGGEVNSAFLRDDCLFSILQYRMGANKPIFMTSNFSIDELEKHFKEEKNGLNSASASRIVERIKMMTNVYEVEDKNYRVE